MALYVISHQYSVLMLYSDKSMNHGVRHIWWTSAGALAGVSMYGSARCDYLNMRILIKFSKL